MEKEGKEISDSEEEVKLSDDGATETDSKPSKPLTAKVKKKHVKLHEVTSKFEEEISKKEPSKDALTVIFNELYTLATKDQLTGVLNRRSFEETLGKEVIKAIIENKTLSAIMIDIDNFKHYNDTYGHIQGDEALREVTRVVSKNTRGQDFVARYGGEEFIVILPGASIKEAETIAERMRKQVAETKIKPTRKGLPQGYDKTTISMGISELGKEGVQGMLEGADQALYQAKREGKNRIKILKK